MTLSCTFQLRLSLLLSAGQHGALRSLQSPVQGTVYGCELSALEGLQSRQRSRKGVGKEAGDAVTTAL